MSVNVCTICKHEKPLTKDFFRWRADRQKFINQCFDCVKSKQKQYREKNKEKLSNQAKFWYRQNKDRILKSSKIYYINNRDSILSYQHDYYQSNQAKKLQYNHDYKVVNKQQLVDWSKQYYINYKDKILSKNKAYRQANKAKINSYFRNRRKYDICFRLRGLVSSAIRRQLKKQSSSKNCSCLIKLEFSIEKLRQHFESQFETWMNWDNHGVYNASAWDDTNHSTWTWQIDHIVPHSKFHYKSMDCEEFKKCWALSNLRPLSAKQNFLDGVSRARH